MLTTREIILNSTVTDQQHGAYATELDKSLVCHHLRPCYTDMTTAHLQHNSYAQFLQQHSSLLKEKFKRSRTLKKIQIINLLKILSELLQIKHKL